MAKPNPLHRHWTAEQDAEIARVYQAREHGGLTRLAKAWGIPNTTISNRARRNGIPTTKRYRFRHRLWTAAEDQVLIEHGHRPMADLRRRLQAVAGSERGIKAIQNRRGELKRAGHPVGLYRDDFTTEELAEAMGCGPQTVVLWINRGWLKATSMAPDSPRAKYYRISERDLRRFCLEHTAAITRVQPDLVWYTDLIGRVAP